MNRDRLQKLADHLRTVPPEQFDMSFWWCGTAGCAAGHACQIPEFREAGLVIYGCFIVYPKRFAPFDPSLVSSFNSVMDFFELEYGAAKYIFLPSQYAVDHATTADVIARIAFVVQLQGHNDAAIDGNESLSLC